MAIDRRAVVRRHNPVLIGPDPRSPLSVGNGELTYTADITGFQNFGGEVPLCTMTQWGFHSYPSSLSREERYRRLRRRMYQTGSRWVGYMSDSSGQEELFRELRVSPHRANLVRISLVEAGTDGARLLLRECEGFRQRLDLWEGAIDSTFTCKGGSVRTAVVCHPRRDALAFTIEIPENENRRMEVELAFPYPSPQIDGSDWSADADGRHETQVYRTAIKGVYAIGRRVDDFVYTLVVRLGPFGYIRETGPHRCVVGSRSVTTAFTAEFLPGSPPMELPVDVAPDWDRCRHDAADHWESFWSTGAFIDLGGSSDDRAEELERRIILSRYLTAIQCAGSLPPQETGLTCNSWYGKFHLEMHPWHALHFPLWGQPDLLAKSMDFYLRIADAARDRAAEQGYAGLRWPKMTDPEGYDSPSEIGTLLCWQQPHFIVMAELLYRWALKAPARKTGAGEDLLNRYAPLVFESAEFMAAYARLENVAPDVAATNGATPDAGTPFPAGSDARFHLGPPVIPAQENHDPGATVDPLFEVEYWRLGLEIAAAWKRRVGQRVPDRWEAVRRRLADPSLDRKTGAYAAHAACNDTYGAYATDHPSFLIAGSYFQGERIDPDIMNRSLDAVLRHWDFDSAWGWDFPVMAMVAARLGRPGEAVSFLLMDAQKNTYLPNGHNAQLPKSDLPIYLPGNGALLTAVAMMAGGWKGSVAEAPGFPKDGSWVVDCEGFFPLPY